jgi:hypothetical protein
MTSKRSHEGYFLLDHSSGPGVPVEAVLSAGLEMKAASGLYECATFTCSHCEAVVYINQKRTRDRAWCKKCDHYLCDGCGAELHLTGICYPMKARAADIINAELRKTASVEAFALPSSGEVFQSPLLASEEPSSIIIP